MELDEAAGDWRGVAENARRLLAVNPLIPAPHRQLARAAEHLGERDEALTAYRALSLLDDTDPADVHYRLAKLLHQAGKPDEARREVLKSLEEAPRFLDAHRLLLELVEADPSQPRADSPSSRSPSRKRQTMTRRRLTLLAILGLLAIASGVCLAQFGPFEAADGGGRPPEDSPTTAPECRTGRSTSGSRTMSSPSSASNTTRAGTAAAGRRRRIRRRLAVAGAGG